VNARIRPVDRSRASGQETRRRIVAAAGELFSTRRYEDVTIRDIAAAADADPALVIRYFGSKSDLFVLVRQPDMHLTPAPGEPPTAASLTRGLVELSLAQGSSLFDLAEAGGPQAAALIRTRLETGLIEPLMDALGLAPTGRDNLEAVAGLITGLSFLRHVQAPGLSGLNAGQLTELLTPAVRALLDTAPRRAAAPNEERPVDML
jgi:AcrR family transcriptional regulator